MRNSAEGNPLKYSKEVVSMKKFLSLALILVLTLSLFSAAFPECSDLGSPDCTSVGADIIAQNCSALSRASTYSRYFVRTLFSFSLTSCTVIP